MNEIIQIEAPLLPALPPKTLQEQREDLRLRLQINRRLLAHKLTSGNNNNSEGYVPRSATMRFLTRQSTRHIVQRIAGTALGLQAFKSLRYGYSVVQFIRSAYSAVKATHNVVKAKSDI